MSSFTPDFDLVTDQDGNRIVVRGELDSGTCDELLEAFQRLAARDEITLDLSAVSFIDSAGTRVVILIERSAQAAGMALHLVPPGEGVTELLRTAGVIERFDLEPRAPGLAEPRSELVERVDLPLPRDPASPARARREVREALHGRDETQLADITLLTSEIVTNAVVHPRGVGETPVGLRILNYGEAIRVEVEDAGEGFDPTIPSIPAPHRGRGLLLVDRFASRWGAQHIHTDDGRRFQVWFEVDAEVPRGLEAARA